MSGCKRSSGRFARPAGIVDLTAPLYAGMPVYPGDPPFQFAWHARLAEAGCNVGWIGTSLHAGTHVDAPLHYLEGGAGVAELPLAQCVAPAVALEVLVEAGREIAPDDIPCDEIRPGDVVLIRTGWEERVGTAGYFGDEWPGFSPEAVRRVVEQRAAALGSDTVSVDSRRAAANGAPAHRLLLEMGIVVFEGLVNLRAVVGRRFTFVGLPLRLEGAEASPVRAIAILDERR